MKVRIINQQKFDNRIKLDPYLKRKWLTHLNSGMYGKGKNALLSSRQYCCLGVLCEVVGWEKQPRSIISNSFDFISNFEIDSSFLPVSIDGVGRRGEFQGFEIEINGQDGISSLAALNDVTPTFKEVIEIINEYF